MSMTVQHNHEQNHQLL